METLMVRRFKIKVLLLKQLLTWSMIIKATITFNCKTQIVANSATDIVLNSISPIVTFLESQLEQFIIEKSISQVFIELTLRQLSWSHWRSELPSMKISSSSCVWLILETTREVSSVNRFRWALPFIIVYKKYNTTGPKTNPHDTTVLTETY